ncbi:MAG: hypothetical protein WD844_02535 [Thermoleophilaceae bacterium]
MHRLTLTVLACIAAALATAPAAFAATNITVVAGGGTVNNSGAPNFTPTGPDSQVGADLINAQLNAGTDVTLDTSPDNLEAGTITVNAAISSAGTGDLTLDADDPITQSASITVGDLSVITNTLDDVVLTNALNDFGSVTTGAGLVATLQLTDQDGLSLGPLSANSSATIDAGGAVTQTGAAMVSGTVRFDVGSANDVTLTNAGNLIGALAIDSADDVDIVTTTALSLGTSVISDDLSVTAGSFIGQTGAVDIAGTATLDAGAASDITLNNVANDFTSVVIAEAHDVSLTDGSDLALGTSAVGGNLTAIATGALTQSGALTVAGTATATGQPVTLDQPGNDFAGAVRITSNGGSPAVVIDANDLTLADSTSGGALTAWAGDDLTVTGGETVAATGALRLVADNQSPAAPAIGTGGITVGTNAVLTGTGAVLLYAARRGDNAIDPTATFNASTFTPGPLFVPSAREQWGVYSPGGTATAPFTFFYKDADTSLPQAAITTPTDGATYEQGQVVNAAYSCSDNAGGSGIATCAGTVANGSPVDTATAGQKTFTVEAVDGAGNRRTTSVTYTVAAPSAAPPPPPPGGGGNPAGSAALHVNRGTIAYGGLLRLSGHMGNQPGQPMTIERRPADQSRAAQTDFRAFQQLTTGGDGGFETAFRIGTSQQFRITGPDGTSQIREIAVRPRVATLLRGANLRSGRNYTARPGEALRLALRVTPMKRQLVFRVERRGNDGEYHATQRRVVRTRRGRANISFAIAEPGTYRIRVLSFGDRLHAAGRSHPITVTTR